MKDKAFNLHDHMRQDADGKLCMLSPAAVILIIADMLHREECDKNAREGARQFLLEIHGRLRGAKYPRAEVLETMMFQGRVSRQRFLEEMAGAISHIGVGEVQAMIDSLLREAGDG